MNDKQTIEVDRQELARALESIDVGAQAHGRRLLTLAASDNRLTLAVGTQDRAVTAWTSIPAKIAAGALNPVIADGVTVGLGLFREIVDRLRATSISLNFGARAEIRSGVTAIKLCLEDRVFGAEPIPEQCELTEIASHKLVDLIDKTLFSVSTDEARVNLNGALFESNGKTGTMVSTDGHRLTRHSIPLEGPAWDPILIPGSGLIEIRRILVGEPRESCRIGAVETASAPAVGGVTSHLLIAHGDMKLAIRLSNAKFPPWQQVVPRHVNHRAELNRQELMDALRVVDLVSIKPQHTAVFRFDADGLISITATGQDGDASTKLSSVWTGEPVTAGVNATYVLEALGALDTERVSVEIEGPGLGPWVMRPLGCSTDLMAIVMPMRI